MAVKKLLTSKKHVFWQAFFLTVLFFLLGLVLGVYIEQLRADATNVNFYNSEVSLYDSFALGQVLQTSNVSCTIMKSDIVKFADQVYAEAQQLEQYDAADKLTQSIKIIHRKYDLLRTLLWLDIMNVEEKNPNCKINTVVYLYKYDTQDVNLSAQQLVMSRVLQQMKNDEGNNVVLLPIATDQSIDSLNFLMQKYNITKSPAIVINHKYVFYKIDTAAQIESYINNTLNSTIPSQ